jgi:hypothetical protein
MEQLTQCCNSYFKKGDRVIIDVFDDKHYPHNNKLATVIRKINSEIDGWILSQCWYHVLLDEEVYFPEIPVSCCYLKLEDNMINKPKLKQGDRVVVIESDNIESNHFKNMNGTVIKSLKIFKDENGNRVKRDEVIDGKHKATYMYHVKIDCIDYTNIFNETSLELIEDISKIPPKFNMGDTVSYIGNNIKQIKNLEGVITDITKISCQTEYLYSVTFDCGIVGIRKEQFLESSLRLVTPLPKADNKDINVLDKANENKVKFKVGDFVFVEPFKEIGKIIEVCLKQDVNPFVYLVQFGDEDKRFLIESYLSLIENSDISLELDKLKKTLKTEYVYHIRDYRIVPLTILQEQDPSRHCFAVFDPTYGSYNNIYFINGDGDYYSTYEEAASSLDKKMKIYEGEIDGMRDRLYENYAFLCKQRKSYAETGDVIFEIAKEHDIL